MRITDVLYAPGFGAFYYDDQAAIRAGAARDGFCYSGPPVTAGFQRIRQPAEALSIGLQLEDGFTAWGDAVSVQYSGVGGRDPLFVPQQACEMIEGLLRARLVGLDLNGFLTAADSLLERSAASTLPKAIEYGLSQCLLSGAAHVRQCTEAELLCREFGLPRVARAVPLFAQSGENRHEAVDKMVLKGVDALPHGLINSPDLFGARGGQFLDYVGWTSRRIRELRPDANHVVIHIDLYGMASTHFGADISAIADCLVRAELAAKPFRLQIESPIDCGSLHAQIDGLVLLKERLRALGSSVRLIADEWCNTLEEIAAFAAAGAADLIQIKMPDVGRLQDSVRAVLECKSRNVGAYLGGSCAETELSARISAHVAVATQADLLLAKPAMDVDAAVTIVGNEQRRIVAAFARSGHTRCKEAVRGQRM